MHAVAWCHVPSGICAIVVAVLPPDPESMTNVALPSDVRYHNVTAAPSPGWSAGGGNTYVVNAACPHAVPSASATSCVPPCATSSETCTTEFPGVTVMFGGAATSKLGSATSGSVPHAGSSGTAKL